MAVRLCCGGSLVIFLALLPTLLLLHLTFCPQTLAEPRNDGPDEIAPERLHEIGPSINDMLADLLRVRVTRFADGIVHRVDGMATEPTFAGDTGLLAGMTFYLRPKVRRGVEGGMMLSYTDADGNVRRPAYAANKPRGGKRPHRTKAAVQAYLDRPAAAASPLRTEGYQRPMSGAPALPAMYDPLPGVEEARAVLAEAYANDNTPAVTKCPPAIAKGARFIAGIVGAKQTASVPAPAWHEPEAKPLSPVIEEVAARGNLTSIGRLLGYRGGYADRAGKRALLAEAKKMVTANDNAMKKIAA